MAQGGDANHRWKDRLCDDAQQHRGQVILDPLDVANFSQSAEFRARMAKPTHRKLVIGTFFDSG
jgi:hypothetical protein